LEAILSGKKTEKTTHTHYTIKNRKQLRKAQFETKKEEKIKTIRTKKEKKYPL